MSNMLETPCDICGETQIREDLVEQVFEYGTGNTATTLTAKVPLCICVGCGFAFTDERGESARHDAVCRYHGVLTPAEIIETRENLSLSRAEFAKLLRIGIASLQRWETGRNIQNGSIDSLIRLAANRNNVAVLQGRSVDLEGCAETIVVESHERRVRNFARITNLTYLRGVAAQWPLRLRHELRCTL